MSGFMAGFMGGSGGGNSLDMSSGTGPLHANVDTTFGDWGGDISFAPPAPDGLGFDLNNPAHMLLAGSAILILGAVLMRRAR